MLSGWSANACFHAGRLSGVAGLKFAGPRSPWPLARAGLPCSDIYHSPHFQSLHRKRFMLWFMRDLDIDQLRYNYR